MKNPIEKLLTVIFVILIAVAFFFALKTGINRSEKAECLEWRQQAADYPLWYSTEWQREQCEAHGLPLPR